MLIGGALLVGDQTLVDVNPGQSLFTTVFIAPRTIATLLRGAAVDAQRRPEHRRANPAPGVAQPLANKMLREGPAFYTTMQQVPGFVLNKSQTPFAPLWYDHYEAVKDTPARDAKESENRTAKSEAQNAEMPEILLDPAPAECLCLALTFSTFCILAILTFFFFPSHGRPARITTLNLGTQTVGLAEFQRAENGGVMLNAFRLTEIHSDPSAEAARLPQTRLAISEMRDQLKLKGGPINYAISGQNMFTRFVKLPPVAEDKVESIIGFEAQQNVPFPIEEVVWDYQLVSSGSPDGPVEVVLVAIKSDLLDDLNAATASGGFRTQIVDAAPMALYNAFRYNYSDLPGCSLLVDLGARTTNLIFIEPAKVFSRSIPIGGNTITATSPRSSPRVSPPPRNAKRARATSRWAALTPTTRTPTWPRKPRSSATR